MKQPVLVPESSQGDVKSLLEYLGLNRAAERYSDYLAQAQKENWSHLAFLEKIVSEEAAVKGERTIAHRIREAHFPIIKTIDAFDFSHPALLPQGKILAALSLQFIERNEGLILMGPAGLGKTHLAISIGYAACLKGVRTLFTTAIDMINVLSASLFDHTLHKALKIYTAPRLLIIDEVGYLPFGERGSDLFFQVISARYERGSLILTTNRAFKDWGSIFHETSIASATIDRLSHHSELVKIEGDSYRMKDKKNKKAESLN